MRPVRIALSNDYHVVIAGVATILAQYADQVRVVELTTDREIEEPVDVILYDTFGRLAGDDEKLERIVAENDAKVVVYSWQAYPVDAAMAQGAAGYIHKGLPPEELVAAILAIHRGEYAESPVPEADEEESVPTWPGQEHGLSARESEMLGFIARGLTNEQIASSAFLSVNTVKTYIRTGYRKIGVRSRGQAVRWALTHGFEPD
ncbi:response regulator transcription factor [Nocardioides anomalus]|uniref:Response regulator transcription factor n=1 Tax=Nocardioides anomalus TaxID=2712223 RepID=A0A6G6WF71_9ACTN|nr:response regulator transcription factor [Nocardioides anomalus]QIG43745.1 response regulator transcription factor [Nocardioides anomalus]